MMPEPIEFQIVESLQTALRGISVAGGYFHDVAALAVKLDADAKVEDIVASSGNARPFVILEVVPEGFEYFPAAQVRFTAPFIVHFVNDSDAKTDDAMLTEFYRACADVEKAIAVDTERGGLANDTIVSRREKRGGYEGQLVWSMIAIEVRGNRTYGKPTG